MEGYPQQLLAIVREEALKHIQDIDRAVDEALKRWKKSTDYVNWIDAMIRDAMRGLVHGVRHEQNTEIRREAGVYGQPAKVSMSTGAVNRVAQSVLNTYVIGGMVLGQITGAQLKVFARSEQEKADGYAFNAKLCKRLADLVPDAATVAECVTASKVKKIMREVAPKGSTFRLTGSANGKHRKRQKQPA